jgi:hypothetical protein
MMANWLVDTQTPNALSYLFTAFCFNILNSTIAVAVGCIVTGIGVGT